MDDRTCTRPQCASPVARYPTKVFAVCREHLNERHRAYGRAYYARHRDEVQQRRRARRERALAAARDGSTL